MFFGGLFLDKSGFLVRERHISIPELITWFVIQFKHHLNRFIVLLASFPDLCMVKVNC